MCINFETSILTLVLGTTFNIRNIIKYNNPQITAVSIGWQYVLLMQLFDAIAWKSPEYNTFAAKSAFITNVSHPIVIGIIFLTLLPSDDSTKYIGATITVAYTIWLLYKSNKINEVKYLNTGTNCDHLVYNWWDDFGKGSAYVYILTVLLLVLLFLKPFNFAVMQAAYILITLIISKYIYSCGTASMWCWFAAFAPLFTGLMFEISTK
jgi:hypothetical protein